MFFANGDALNAVSIDMSHGFERSPPKRLFRHPSLVAGFAHRITYDVSADGRFLLSEPIALPGADADPSSINWVENWSEEFRDPEQK